MRRGLPWPWPAGVSPACRPRRGRPGRSRCLRDFERLFEAGWGRAPPTLEDGDRRPVVLRRERADTGVARVFGRDRDRGGAFGRAATIPFDRTVARLVDEGTDSRQVGPDGCLRHSHFLTRRHVYEPRDSRVARAEVHAPATVSGRSGRAVRPEAGHDRSTADRLEADHIVLANVARRRSEAHRSGVRPPGSARRREHASPRGIGRQWNGLPVTFPVWNRSEGTRSVLARWSVRPGSW